MGRQWRSSGVLRAIPDSPASAYRMPLFPAALALAGGGLERAAALSALADAVCALAAFAAAAAAGGAGAGLAAAWLYALWPWRPAGGAALEAFYGLTVAACALSGLWWARDWRDARRGALAGAAAGLSLFCRSALILWPAALAALALRGGGRRALKAAAACALVCAALLCPWWLRNARAFGGFIPFEDGAAGLNAAGAAAGLTSNPGDLSLVGSEHADDFRRAHALPEPRRASALLSYWGRWAAERPFSYAAGCVRRLAALWRFQWPLWLAALPLLRRPEERRRAAPLLALAACFCAYALMGVSPRYAEPAAATLCALAACGLAAALRRAGAPLGGGALSAWAAAFLALLLPPYAYAAARLLREPEAVDARPAEVKALNDRSVDAALSGDAAGAERLLDEALRRDPSFAEALASRMTLRQSAGRADDARADCDALVRSLERPVK